MNRNILNLATLIGLMVVMDYHFTKNMVHEIVGVLIALLFILHNTLNRRWYRSIGKGDLLLLRRIGIAINLLLAFMMLLATVTGVFISRTLFLPISVSGHLWVHELHTLSSYAAFILCGIHLGFHWNALRERVRRLGIDGTNPVSALLGQTVSAFVVCYGVYASFSRHIGSKLLLQQASTSWGAKPLLIDFLLDHLAIMAFYAVMTHYLIRTGLNRRARDTKHVLWEEEEVR